MVHVDLPTIWGKHLRARVVHFKPVSSSYPIFPLLSSATFPSICPSIDLPAVAGKCRKTRNVALIKLVEIIIITNRIRRLRTEIWQNFTWDRWKMPIVTRFKTYEMLLRLMAMSMTLLTRSSDHRWVMSSHSICLWLSKFRGPALLSTYTYLWSQNRNLDQTFGV